MKKKVYRLYRMRLDIRFEKKKKNGKPYNGGSSIENWRKGHLPPNRDTLLELAKILANRGGLNAQEYEQFLRVAGERETKDPSGILFSSAEADPKQEATETHPSDPPSQEHTKPAKSFRLNINWNVQTIKYILVTIALLLTLGLGTLYYWSVNATATLPRGVDNGYVLTASYTDQGPELDGRLDDQAWTKAIPLLFAKHPSKNGSSTASVKLLWDSQYLYAAFDIGDTQVEGSEGTPWDGDSVSFILDSAYINKEQKATEYRHTIRGQEEADRRGANFLSRHVLKDNTTYDDPTNEDTGYTIEMRIPWLRPPTAGAVLKADLLSVDHDSNPGATYDDPGTIFSKIFWAHDTTVDKGAGFLALIKY